MSKFNQMYDVKKLQENLVKVQENGNSDYPEIPCGAYEVKIEKIELGESQKGMPMGKIMFRIVEGEFKKSCLFYNQVLLGTNKETGELTAFGIHNFNEFLASLDTSVVVEFIDFDQYEDMLLDIAEEASKLVYKIQYSKKNNFPKYDVLDIYED